MPESHIPPSPQIHGGLLGVRGNPTHETDMLTHGITPIDLVVVNLYAFEATVAKGGDFDTCIENIDIGGEWGAARFGLCAGPLCGW